jgi:Flp pilus assembly protein TadG
LRAGDDSSRRTTRGEQHRAGTADKGAALIELAFTITLLVMLLVGVVTSAIALGRDNSIQNAAREASRFGATLPDGGMLPWFEDVRDVARAAATGDLDPSVPNDQICVAYVPADHDPATNPTASRIVDVNGSHGGVEPGDWCFDDGRTGNNEVRVQVVNQRGSTINAVIFSTDVTLTAEAAARYER